MKHYFVDLENVHEHGIDGLETICEPAVVYIFGSKSTKNLSIAFQSSANSLLVSWRYEFAENGHKDALDIQLASYLGYQIGQNPNDSFVIVSKDCGYDSMIHSWQSKGFDVDRTECLTSCKTDICYDNHDVEDEAPIVKVEVPLPTQPVADPYDEVRSLLMGHEVDQVEKSIQILKEKTAQIDVYRAMLKAFGVAVGREIYNKIKVFAQSRQPSAHHVPEKSVATREDIRKMVGNLCTKKKLLPVAQAINQNDSKEAIHGAVKLLYSLEPQRGEMLFDALSPLLKSLGKE